MTAVVNWGDPRLPERFWDKCTPEPNTGCWLWTGSAKNGRYPGFAVESANSKHHSGLSPANPRRVAFQKLVGGLSKEDIVYQTCGLTLCCNPSHAERKGGLLTPEKRRLRRERRRDYYFARCLRTKYGLSLDEYRQMTEAQGGACAICRKSFAERERGGIGDAPCVDHCHSTGAVRGLLCGKCNSAIGLLGDDPERMRSAADYIERNKAGN